MTPIDRKNYAKHVESTLSIIADYGPKIPPRVSAIIQQHHEKFDGTGYPKKLEGFRIDDISQLLAVADLIDSMCSGRWDGQERTLMESFDTLEGIQKSSTFPEYFNPEILAAVVRWIHSSDSKVSMNDALERVKKQRGEIVKN
jgi:HD-GYP domain-containing protein (c-di-GMP phosphodiesterase class II)